MLKIYYGPEYMDKSRFIFENISGRTLLLVPDQFSLQAERDAFYYMKAESLMDIRVVGFSTLGHKAAAQAGGPRLPLIDKYGRHMLLTRIINEISEELSVYRHMGWKNSFIELMNTMISEMKRFGASPEDLMNAADKLDNDGFLKYKLQDIQKVFVRYEKAIEGKYLDSEDYITFYGDKLLEAPMVAESDIWIYGFDTFTPKNMEVIEKLLVSARSVNVVMAYDKEDYFSLTGYIMKTLQETAARLGIPSEVSAMDGVTRTTAVGSAMQLISDGKNEMPEDVDFPVTVAQLSNPYEEAERAAAYIQELVRDHGYRYGEIVVVCNDLDVRGAMLRRTLMRWDIPVFTDKKRKVTHHSAVGFLLALMEIISGGYRNEAVMRLIKSGIPDSDLADAELLENYVAQYRIRGAGWKSEFIKGNETYDEDELERINRLRSNIVDIVENARSSIGSRNKAADKIKGLYRFLDEDMDITGRIEAAMEKQTKMNLPEAASETAQSWNVICNILDQIVDTAGEERLSNKELMMLMTAGFEEVEIGLVPVSSDCIIIGTLQRTRLSRIRAMLIIGANEGVLPMGADDAGLLSEREKIRLEDLGLQISKRDLIARKEENIALYRTVYMPREKLYISCSKANSSGEPARPSDIFLQFRDMCPEQNLLKDLKDMPEVPDRLTTGRGSLSYMADALRNCRDGEYIDKDWLRVMNWYRQNEPQMLESVKRGLMFSNAADSIGEKFADELYRGDRQNFEVSASQLEKYSSCPFAHFIRYGLKPEELRSYEIGAREIGDVYHECMMIFSRRLNAGLGAGMSIRDEGSPWMKLTREECSHEIESILHGNLDGYREGLLSAGKAEKYKTERITEICSRIAWTMVEQIRRGSIKEMGFEVPFGQGCRLPEIRVNAGRHDVLIRGKIDRLDMLEGQESAVRVIDYKTGGDTIDIDHLRSGYKLQLMVYLKAGMQQDSSLKPAGVFYFKIHDVDVNADLKKVEHGEKALNERIEESYRLQGIMLDDHELLCSMDTELDTSSNVIPVKLSKKTGTFVPSAGGMMLSEDEFRELSDAVDAQVQRICTEICSGSIAVKPKREKKRDMEGKVRTSCKYCGYKSICMFDTSFKGCRYENI